MLASPKKPNAALWRDELEVNISVPQMNVSEGAGLNSLGIALAVPAIRILEIKATTLAPHIHLISLNLTTKIDIETRVGIVSGPFLPIPALNPANRQPSHL